ncbi:proton-conducting transporter transmembrane domain-containing protein [Natronococcus occultus]|uniref:NADH:ubiquinone oxidoreductase subunit 5 (Chain L)/multisubunit Na+/H+ antiporter, MnhA subunit n=1 Tax=Natronococcus occultus SP4 TaxID=694430 RepID=L0JUT3_9EURY|nr:proton-conducting transporter membrane subunit [Natronococcus occultus]AGB36055.1 NADH:ubiquinone oxidoreductase subunit 5 (chain L)/multisubunit Na+/H+ antiporter, MnhA subunit [Natronococcus occultus SP4]
MSKDTRPSDAGTLAETTTQRTPTIPRASTWAVWTLFLCSVGVLVLTALRGYEWGHPDLVVIDGLTAVMWVVVTFFSGIVHSYSRRYMTGDSGVDRFFGQILAFTVVVMTLTAADHVALFATMWLAMGLLMASLIGHDRDWKQARAAGVLAVKYFLASSALLSTGLVALVWATGATSVSGIVADIDGISTTVVIVAVAAIFLAAIVQSALFPFHGWLLSSMTAPTPASALMHAGFVNAGGILLTRFAPLVGEYLYVMSVVVLVGAFSALLGQAMLLVQTDVKRELGSSTIAQMGFMIMQCGLGFFGAAIAHLILHGCYKAYLFLSSGAPVEHTVPTDKDRTHLGFSGVAVSLLTAVGGGVIFMLLTGKLSGLSVTLNSGIVLTLVVVLTTLTAARDILHRTTLPSSIRLVSVPLVVLTAISAYAVTFNAVSTMLAADVPMTYAPTELTVVHYLVVAGFVGAYLATELGWHRSSERLYVALLNVSQPAPSTVLTSKEDYDDA